MGVVAKDNEAMGRSTTGYAPPQGQITSRMLHPEEGHSSTDRALSYGDSSFRDPYQDVCSEDLQGQSLPDWTVPADCSIWYPDVTVEPGLSQSQQYTSYQVSHGQPQVGVTPPYCQVPQGQPQGGFAPNVYQQGHPHVGFASRHFQQGHPDGGFGPRAFQQTQTSMLLIKPDWLPKSLYLHVDPSDTWIDFYRKFDNYAKDKRWSSHECKSNLTYVLSGKAAKFLGILNEQAPDLPYYDLIIRMERFMTAQQDSEQVSENQYIYNQQTWMERPSLMECGNTYSICETSLYQHDENPAWSNQIQVSQHNSPCREPRHQKQERYVTYRGPENTIHAPVHESSSICSIIKSPEQDNRNILQGVAGVGEKMAHHENTCTSSVHKQKKRYVTFRGDPQNAQKSTVDEATHTSDAGKKCIEMAEAKLEESFTHVEAQLHHLIEIISKSKDLQYETAYSSERKADTPTGHLNHGSQGLSKKVSPNKKRSTSKKLKFEGFEREASESQVLDVTPHREEDMDQEKVSKDYTECKTKPSAEEEQSEERVIALDSVESYEDFINSMYFETFASSTLKVEALETCQEYEDWIGEKFEGTFNTLSLYSIEDAVTSNEVVQEEFEELRQEAVLEDNISMEVNSDRAQREPNIISDSNLSASFPSPSGGLDLIQPLTKEKGLATQNCAVTEHHSFKIGDGGETSETLKDYEAWKDGIDERNFGSSSPKVESLCSAQDYEDWIDNRCREIGDNFSLNATHTDLNGEYIPPGQDPSDIQSNPVGITCLQEIQGKADVSCQKNQDKAGISCRESQDKADVNCQEIQDKADVRCRENQDKAGVSCLEIQDKADVSCREIQDKADVSCRKNQDKAGVSCREIQDNADVSCRKNQDKACISCRESQGKEIQGKVDVSCQENQDKTDVSCREIQGIAGVNCREIQGVADVSFSENQGIADVNCQENQGNRDVSCRENQGKVDVSCRKSQGKADIHPQESQGTAAIYPQENQGKSDFTHAQENQGKSYNTRALENQGKSNCNTRLYDTIAHLFSAERKHYGVPIPEKAVNCRSLTGTIVPQISVLLQRQTEPNKIEITCIQASGLLQTGCTPATTSVMFRSVPNTVGPQDYSKKTHWTFCQNLVQLLVKGVTQWPWDPGGSSEEKTLFMEMPGKSICQIRVETFSSELVLRPQKTHVSVGKRFIFTDLILEQESANLIGAGVIGRPQSHDQYFYFHQTAKELLGIEDVEIASSTDTLLYPQQLPVEAAERVMIVSDPATLSPVNSKCQVETTHRSGSASSDKASSPELRLIPRHLLWIPAEELIAVTLDNGWQLFQ